MKHRWCAAVMASIVLLSIPDLVVAANDGGPEVRQYSALPNVCSRGLKKGCICNPTLRDPNGICSDIPFRDFSFFDRATPQCVPLTAGQPKISGIMTIIVDDQVTDYHQTAGPLFHRAFTVLLEVDGHLFADTYQNVEDPTAVPRGAWQVVNAVTGQRDFEPIEENAFFNFFDKTQKGRRLLGVFNPFLYLAPDRALGRDLRAFFNHPGSLPLIVSVVDEQSDLDRFEDGSGASDPKAKPLASVVRFKVDIVFADPTEPSSGKRCDESVCIDDALPFNGTSAEGDTRNGQSRISDSQCGGSNSPEIVYEWTPTTSERVSIGTTVSGSYDSIVSVREAECGTSQCAAPTCEVGAEIACNDNSRECRQSSKESSLVVDVEAGRTYFVVVDGVSTAGQFKLSVSQPSPNPTPGPNVVCAHTPIPAIGGTVTGTTSGGAPVPGLSVCDDDDGPEAVFTWTPEVSGVARIATCEAGTDFDTAVSVRDGTCGGTRIAYDDDGCFNDISLHEFVASVITPTVEAGKTYVIVVDGVDKSNGRSSDRGNFKLSVTPPTSAAGDQP
ncbi:MAG: hypothetical protein ABIR79_21975 [Candidatus Binatia bacterium]